MLEKAVFVEKFKKRTKQLALDVIKLHDKINKTDASKVVGRQLIRSATSVAANYRAACIARSKKEFFAKMSIVVEEADETVFWLEILKDANFISEELIDPLIDEAIEILKVVSRARKNTNF